MNEAPSDWMWKEAPGEWWWGVLHIARAMREAKPGGADGRDAVLEMLGFEDAILTMHQVGALLFRILVGKEDARKVFLKDKRPRHVRMATAYWLARAGDPSAPDDSAIEAARGIQTGKSPRPLSATTVRKIAQQYRSEVFEDFEEGDDLYGIGIPSPEGFRRLKAHLWRKVGPKIGLSEEFPKEVRFPELDPAVRGHMRRSKAQKARRGATWHCKMPSSGCELCLTMQAAGRTDSTPPW